MLGIFRTHHPTHSTRKFTSSKIGKTQKNMLTKQPDNLNWNEANIHGGFEFSSFMIFISLSYFISDYCCFLCSLYSIFYSVSTSYFGCDIFKYFYYKFFLVKFSSKLVIVISLLPVMRSSCFLLPVALIWMNLNSAVISAERFFSQIWWFNGEVLSISCNVLLYVIMLCLLMLEFHPLYFELTFYNFYPMVNFHSPYGKFCLLLSHWKAFEALFRLSE